jgi:hypothetical protein
LEQAMEIYCVIDKEYIEVIKVFASEIKAREWVKQIVEEADEDYSRFGIQAMQIE